jgi:hypothetical protein
MNDQDYYNAEAQTRPLTQAELSLIMHRARNKRDVVLLKQQIGYLRKILKWPMETKHD